jgi:hypothetical protein
LLNLAQSIERAAESSVCPPETDVINLFLCHKYFVFVQKLQFLVLPIISYYLKYNKSQPS